MSTKLSPETGAGESIAPAPLALIAGPTASGKTGLSIKLAKALENVGKPAAIINCDSAQVYADLRILSARPDEKETQEVPHHLFGAWDGSAACSTVEWAQAARRTIDDLHRASIVPILVGGTGLYIRTLLDGISPIPQIDKQVRASVRSLDQAEARAALEREDPVAAARLAPADRARTARALEVIRSSGKPISFWHRQSQGGIADRIELHPLILAPDREKLFARCDQRFEQMLQEGAVQEVERLLARNLDPELPVMRAIGVREIGAWLAGNSTREAMIEAGKLATRQYAKRQYTWFRNQPPQEWPRCDSVNSIDLEIFEILLR